MKLITIGSIGLAILLLSGIILPHSSQAAFADEPNTPCSVRIQRISASAKTEYGLIPYNFVRVQIASIGNLQINKTFDKVTVGASVDGAALETIEVNSGGSKIEIYVSIGYGENPNRVSFGAEDKPPSNICFL